MLFDPYAPEDLSSEEVLDKAIQTMGGLRATTLLGTTVKLKNADWVFPKEKFVIEHKQLETSLTSGNGFKSSEIALRGRYARAKKATVFGVVKDEHAAEFSQEYAQLFRKPLARILKKANVQIRETRTRLQWPKGRGVVILSNRGFFRLTPLALCALVQSILEGAYSEIGGVAYVTNHYLHTPGSGLANRLWAPIYKLDQGAPPEEIMCFVDDLGRGVRRFLGESIPDFVQSEHAGETDDALRYLLSRPIVPRSG